MNETPKDTSEEKDRYMPVVRNQDSGKVELVKPKPLIAYDAAYGEQEIKSQKKGSVKNSRKRTTLSREQLGKLLLENIEIFSEHEALLLRAAFDLKVLTAQEVMVPLSELTPLTIASPLSEVPAYYRTFNYRYIPIYNERIDHLLGVIDFMEVLTTDQPNNGLSAFVRDVPYVPSLKSAMDLLGELRQSEIPVAVVVSERGSCIGIVELADILEKIVGEIRANRKRDTPRIEKLGENEWRLDARMLIGDVNIALNIQLPTDRCDTIGGFFLMLLGRLPQKGEKIEYEDHEFSIEEIFKYGISRIHVVKKLQTPR